MTPHTRRKLILLWRRHVRPILVLVLVFTACRSSLVDWNDVPTGSMQPTIFIGDRIFVNKLAYGFKFPYTTWHLAKWSGPKRGEVVIFYSPQDGTRLVKRVIGIPGDRIAYRDGFVYLNGEKLPVTPFHPPADYKLPEDQYKNYLFYKEQVGDDSHVIALLTNTAMYARQDVAGNPVPPPPRNMEERTVPDGHYFVMGDNRDNSNDSRFIGTVPREQILGRANRVIFSLDYKDWYLPRKERFFKELP